MYMKLAELPSTLRSALDALGYGRADIKIEPRESYCVHDAGEAGMRGFAIAVNLATGERAETWGSWGGANMFNPRNAVDLDTRDHALPVNGAVIVGSQGGRGTFASVYVHPQNIAAMLPAPREALSEREQLALDCVGSCVSSYRKDVFARGGLGAYGPTNEYVVALAAKGLVKIAGKGVSITTEGKNQRSNRCL